MSAVNINLKTTGKIAGIIVIILAVISVLIELYNVFKNTDKQSQGKNDKIINVVSPVFINNNSNYEQNKKAQVMNINNERLTVPATGGPVIEQGITLLIQGAEPNEELTLDLGGYGRFNTRANIKGEAKFTNLPVDVHGTLIRSSGERLNVFTSSIEYPLKPRSP